MSQEKITIGYEKVLQRYKDDEKGRPLLEYLFGNELFQEEITDRIKTFEDVLEELGEIKSLLQELLEKKSPKQTEEFLTIQEAAKFLSLSVPTIYSKVSRGELPASKPGGKHLYFSSAELRDYMKGYRKKTDAKLIAAAPDMLEALENIQGLLYSTGLIDSGDLRRIVDLAIKKALGK